LPLLSRWRRGLGHSPRSCRLSWLSRHLCFRRNNTKSGKRGGARHARECPMPIHFSDDQLTEIFRLTKPLAPAHRDEFLQILAAELRDRNDVGDGELYRIARQIIRDNHLFEAPLIEERGRARRSA